MSWGKESCFSGLGKEMMDKNFKLGFSTLFLPWGGVRKCQAGHVDQGMICNSIEQTFLDFTKQYSHSEFLFKLPKFCLQTYSVIKINTVTMKNYINMLKEGQ